jgi:hypothetical protein
MSAARHRTSSNGLRNIRARNNTHTSLPLEEFHRNEPSAAHTARPPPLICEFGHNLRDSPAVAQFWPATICRCTPVGSIETSLARRRDGDESALRTPDVPQRETRF